MIGHKTAGWFALSVAAALALAGCGSTRSPGTAAGYLDAPFSHSVHVGAVTINPPAIGSFPLVSVARARNIALHPSSWLAGVGHDELVAFGYGRVSTSAPTASGRQPFRDGRLAWVAVYRAAAADVRVNGCLGGPAVRAGYHLVPSNPKPAHFYITVVVDATTGEQATATPPLRDVCPRLVRNARSPDTPGTITRI
jgi:hypothetical protein